DGTRLRAALEQNGASVSVGDDGALHVTGAEAPAIGQAAADTGTVLHELTPQRASLAEAFMELTRYSVEYHADAAAAAGAGPPHQGAGHDHDDRPGRRQAGAAHRCGDAVPAPDGDGVDQAAQRPLDDVDTAVDAAGEHRPAGAVRAGRHQRPARSRA